MRIGRRLAVSLLLASCGGDADTTNVHEPSSWLGPCTSDAGCGVGQCLCGLCTLSCASEGCSAGPPSSECIATDHFAHAGLCAGRVSEPICLSTCSDDALCGADQACVEGICLSAATAAIAGAARDAGAAPSLCAVNPVVSRSLRVENQAQLDALAGCERIDGDLTLDLFPRANASSLGSLRVVTGTLTARVAAAASPEPLPVFAALERVGGLYLSRLRLEGPLALPRLTAIQPGSDLDINRGGLSIVDCSGFLNLTAFAAVEELSFLFVSGSPDLTRLEGLNALRRLQRLTLVETGVLDLSPLARASGLREIMLLGNSELESLEGLGEGRDLRRVMLADNDRLVSLRGLAVPAALSELAIHDSERLATLTGLEALRRVDTLELRELPALTSLTGLDGLERVAAFSLSYTRGLVGLMGLGRLEQVGLLVLTQASALRSLVGLGTLSLPEIYVSGTALTDLTGLEGVTGLVSITLSDNAELASLDGLPVPEATAFVHIRHSPRLVDLGRLREATALGSLSLTEVGVPDLDALESLRQVASLQLSSNPALVHVDALGPVQISSDLIITDNPLLVRLPELAGVMQLESGSPLTVEISRNPSLSEGPAFPALEQAGVINVLDNGALPRLTGFAAVRQVGSLRIENNAALSQLDFSALQSAETIVVRGHPLLTDDQVSSLADIPTSILEKVVSGTGRDPCPWLEDDFCDEQFADCAPGSDAMDCAEVPSVIPSENR